MNLPLLQIIVFSFFNFLVGLCRRAAHLCEADGRAGHVLVLDGRVLDVHRAPGVAEGADALRHVAVEEACTRTRRRMGRGDGREKMYVHVYIKMHTRAPQENAGFNAYQALCSRLTGV